MWEEASLMEGKVDMRNSTIGQIWSRKVANDLQLKEVYAAVAGQTQGASIANARLRASQGLEEETGLEAPKVQQPDPPAALREHLCRE